MSKYLSGMRASLAFFALISSSGIASATPTPEVTTESAQVLFQICVNPAEPEPLKKDALPRLCFDRTLTVGPAGSQESAASAKIDVTYAYPVIDRAVEPVSHFDVQVEADWDASSSSSILANVKIDATESTKSDGPGYRWFSTEKGDRMGLPNRQVLGTRQEWTVLLSPGAPPQARSERYSLTLTRIR